MTDIVAVENVNMAAHGEQLALEFRRHGGFAGAGQTGEPDHAADVAVAQFALASGDLAVAPIDVVALGMSVVRAPRVAVGSNDAPASQVVAIDDDEAAH